MSEITLKGKIRRMGDGFPNVKVSPVVNIQVENDDFLVEQEQFPADWHEGQEVTITIRSVEK